MTIQEGYKYISEQLLAIYDEAEAENISDWVVENLTGTRRTDRIVNKSQSLTEIQSTRLDHYLKKLLANEPIQYVLNEAWFCGLKFYVDNNVLIPRPETEELVEWIIADCKFPIDKLSVLDIGTGSGCIAIAVKRRLGKVGVWSCDISPAALQVAKKNATTLGVEINFIGLDFLDKKQWEKLPSFDIIVSNPPYIPSGGRKEMNANVLEYEPETALFVPDKDPFIFYVAIADFAREHLNFRGSIYTEINEAFGEETAAIFRAKGYNTEIKKDIQGKDRMIKAWLSRA